jgi:cold shock CspA family protein
VRGTMLWFNPRKGFGFLRSDEGDRFLVRTDGISPGNDLGDGCAGTAVEFDRDTAIDPEGGGIATRVTVVLEAEGNRARSRRHRL